MACMTVQRSMAFYLFRGRSLNNTHYLFYQPFLCVCTYYKMCVFNVQNWFPGHLEFIFLGIFS